MAYKITWSAEAKLTYLSIIKYLEENWTEKEIINFVDRVHNKLNLLSVQPAIGKVHKKEVPDPQNSGSQTRFISLSHQASQERDRSVNVLG